MNCVKCGKMSNHLKKEINIIIKNKFSSDVSDLIIDYVGDSDSLFQLHSKYKETDKPHSICNKCFQRLQTIALMCDTNMSRCPICPRQIFLPY